MIALYATTMLHYSLRESFLALELLNGIEFFSTGGF